MLAIGGENSTYCFSDHNEDGRTTVNLQARTSKKTELADLYLLGIGIGGLNQTTKETLEALSQCRILFHLSDRHESLKRINRNTVNLDDFYWTNEDRGIVYKRIISKVIEEVKRAPGVAIVSYGHPLVFDEISATLRRRTIRLRKRCVVLPAISCLDTLCIDLCIDYGDGLQVFEATSLINLRLPMCARIHTLIFQVYEFGEDVTADAIVPVTGRFRPLEAYLARFFPDKHRAILVYSDDGDSEGPLKLRTTIRGIDKYQISMFPGVSLYVPPIE